MRVEITDEMARKATIAHPRDGYLRDALEAIAPISADMALERARELAKPHGPRPCDCELCYCDDPHDAAAVAVWDAQHYIDDAIRALKEPTP